MKKLKFFFSLNRRYRAKNGLLFLVYFMAGIIISASMLIQKNNHIFYEAQILKLARTSSGAETDSSQLLNEFQILSEHVNTILGIFVLAGILTVVWGSVSLLFFKDSCLQKTYAICRIFGMRKEDMIYRAAADLLQYGVLAGILGMAAGFGFFVVLSRKLCHTKNMIFVFSSETLKVLFFVTLLLGIVAFFSSLIAGNYMMEKPEANILYERQTKFSCKKTLYLSLAGFILLMSALRTGFGKLKYMNWMFGILLILMVLLGTIFYYAFYVHAGRHRHKKRLSGPWDLSYRFLCTRYKRDAMLAATVSVGAVLVCFILTVEFHLGDILRSSYIDNMGYSVTVRTDTYGDGMRIEKLLDANGYTYTALSSKLMDYRELAGGTGMDGKLWMAVIGNRTDDNEHFLTPRGTFWAENYFIGKFGLLEKSEYDILGKPLLFDRRITENQGMSLVSYNVLVNEADWKLPLDSSWNKVFLLNLTLKEEQNLLDVLAHEPCRMETASQLIDEINLLMKDYLMVISVAGTMLVLVTGTFFYCMIQNDLLERKTEIFLYRIYGASHKNSVGIIFMEYIRIAVIASFSVVFVIMLLGELFFFYMLRRHYPLSFTVVLVTTALVSGFVLLCCIFAERLTWKGQNIGLIRDE